MEAITLLRNESNNHRLLQIDLDMLTNEEGQLEDVYDIIAVEMRKNEEATSWEDVRQQLLQQGK